MLRLLTLVAFLAGVPALGQEAPRVLFPAETPPAQGPSKPDAPIGVQDLPAPAARTAGLAAAEAELAGPLWERGAPPAIAQLLQQLPTAIDEPSLRELQRALLAAAGPASVAPDGLLALRVDRLLAMGEAATALEVLAQAPPGPVREFDALRLRASFAVGQAASACENLGESADDASPWVEAKVVCAALARDATAVEIGLDRLVALDITVDPSLAGLARAAAAGARFSLRSPVSGDAMLLPLLRTVPLDLSSSDPASLPEPARKALAENPGIASAVRAAAVAPARLGPSVRPELSGAAPTDWAAAMASVPEDQRNRWAALVDGLGVTIPELVWSGLAEAPDPGPAPKLALWQGFEVARLQEQRGAILLYVLLLLDGRPEAAAPVTLRRSLDALVALGLERDARALASGTGGALGL